jgi:hypothetical protein
MYTEARRWDIAGVASLRRPAPTRNSAQYIDDATARIMLGRKQV